jgi:hypothetical protein
VPSWRKRSAHYAAVSEMYGLAIHDALGDLEPDLPPLPEPEAAPDDEGWLFDSRRDYLDQLEHYKTRKA